MFIGRFLSNQLGFQPVNRSRSVAEEEQVPEEKALKDDSGSDPKALNDDCANIPASFFANHFRAFNDYKCPHCGTPQTPGMPEVSGPSGEEGTPQAPGLPENGANTPTAPKYDLDYSQVENLDKDVRDLADESKLYPDGKLELKGITDPIDAGVYDDVFAEMSKMEPQFKEYIKAQMAEKGYEYNEETVQKYIEQYLTEAVELAATDTIASLIGQDVERPKTMREAIDYVMMLIDRELGNIQPDPHTIEGLIKQQLGDRDSIPFNATEMFQAQMLPDTADYFLTEDEKDLKHAIHAWENEGSSYGYSAKETVEHYMDSFSQYVDAFLEEMWGIINPSQREAIMRLAKTEVLKALKANDDGMYSLDEALKAMYEKCYEAGKNVANLPKK